MGRRLLRGAAAVVLLAGAAWWSVQPTHGPLRREADGRVVIDKEYIDALRHGRGFPPLFRALNWALGWVAPDTLAPFTPGALLDAARAREGLPPGARFSADRVDAEYWRAGLAALCDDVSGGATWLTPMGRLIFREIVIAALVVQLRLERILTLHPEVATKPNPGLDRPLILSGLGRTGTFHLHGILARHPALQSITQLDFIEPLLPFGTDPALINTAADPRRVLFDVGTWLQRLIPLTPLLIPLRAGTATEEIRHFAATFSTQFFECVCLPLPAFTRWYDEADHAPSFEHFKIVLRAVEWQRHGLGDGWGSRRWVLKRPEAAEQLPLVTAAFPRARYVFTHRDPGAIVQSLTVLLAYTMALQVDVADAAVVARHWVDNTAKTAEAMARDSAALEARGVLTAANQLHIPFEEYMADQVGTAVRILQFADLEVNATVEQGVRNYLDDHPRVGTLKVRYRLIRTALGEEYERGIPAMFPLYTERFLRPAAASGGTAAPKGR